MMSLVIATVFVVDLPIILTSTSSKVHIIFAITVIYYQWLHQLLVLQVNIDFTVIFTLPLAIALPSISTTSITSLATTTTSMYFCTVLFTYIISSVSIND